MRRSATGAIAVLLGALLALPAEATAAPVDVSGGFGGFRASAQWLFPPESPRSGQTFAFAEVYQSATSTDGGGIAVVGIGVCVFVRDTDTTRECRGSGFTHELVAGELELSPTLGSARVDYFEGGNGYHLAWEATDQVPTVAPAYGTSESAVVAGGKIVRNAVADGTVIGLALDQAIDRAANLSRGGSFGATLQPVDGRVDVRFSLQAR